MRRLILITAAGALLSVCGQASAYATPRLASPFSNHMVLQRQMQDPVWGWASPGETIKVTFAGKSEKTVANAHGQWMVKLPPMEASARGRNLRVSDKRGHIAIHDVLVGEVWLCSGQSNMHYQLRGWTPGGNPAAAIAKAEFPEIRYVTVPDQVAGLPQRTYKDMWDEYPDMLNGKWKNGEKGAMVKQRDGKWHRVSPSLAPNMSAVAYYFGRDLHRALHVPVGLIIDDWGGTRIQPWTPLQAYENTPQLHRGFLELKKHPIAMSHVNVRSSISLPRTSIYNGMIFPLIPYAIRGVVWYQGESNVKFNSRTYGLRLEAMVKAWRQAWGEGLFPFGIVQIAPWRDYPPGLEPLLWQGQERAARSLENAGIIGTMDLVGRQIGTPHPADKWDVGRRLELWAFAKVYGHRSVCYSGPVFNKAYPEGHRVIVTFSHAAGGLRSSNGKALTWFQLAGRSGKFVDADAQIEGKTVVVSAPGVTKPVAIRFGWSRLAEPNLANKAGLPALPFESDLNQR